MRLATALLVATCFAVAAGTAHASTGGGFDPGDGDVVVWAKSRAIVTRGGRPVCDWQRLTNREAAELDGLGGHADWDPDDPRWSEWFQTTINGVSVDGYIVDCPGLLHQFRWVDPNVTARDLIPAVLAVADETIGPPLADVNPPVTVRGVVNLGMWLAVTEASYVPIAAVAGPADWIVATPTVGTTTFDFGNGDAVTCAGFGTPVTDLDTIDEGPCGYTYRRPGTYTLTVSTVWRLPYTSSDGPGEIAPLTRTSTFHYVVGEIITVGTDG